MDFDAIFEDVGTFGRYQKLVIYLMLLPAGIPYGFHAYSQLFMGPEVPHWCHVPELDRLEDQGVVKNLSIPLEFKNGEFQYSQCTMYNLNYSDIINNYQDSREAVQKEPPAPVDVVPCKHGWTYDRTIYQNTIINEWNLVCDHDFYPTLGLALLGVGGIIGNTIYGYFQDYMGRKPPFFIYLFVQCVFGVATAFAPNYISWTIFRIGVGLTVPAIMNTPNVLAIELVGSRHRSMCAVITSVGNSVGLSLLAGVAYLVRDWRHLALTTTLPFVSYFMFIWFMPESPLWLLARGQFDKAEVILKNMARINGKSLPANYMVQLQRKYETNKLNQESENNKPRKYGMLDLFRTPNLRNKTILITFIAIINSCVDVGLWYYALVLGGDKFLNFFLAGIVELPTYLFLWLSMERLGRRRTLCTSTFVGGVACITTFLVQNDSKITLILYCLGKMGIVASCVVLPLMASEMYPTVVRGLGMSFSSVLPMFGPIIIPLLNYLSSDSMLLPLIVMGALLVAAGVASFLLPETLNQQLPQTIEDSEKMGLSTYFCCNLSTKKITTKSVDKNNTELFTCSASNACTASLLETVVEKDT